MVEKIGGSVEVTAALSVPVLSLVLGGIVVVGIGPLLSVGCETVGGKVGVTGASSAASASAMLTKYLFSVSISVKIWTCLVQCTAVGAPVFVLAVEEGSGGSLLPPTMVELAMVGCENQVNKVILVSVLENLRRNHVENEENNSFERKTRGKQGAF